jgi:hypothetical protein
MIPEGETGGQGNAIGLELSKKTRRTLRKI